MLVIGKVFAKLSFTVPENVIKGAVNSRPGVIEFVLNNLRVKVCLSFRSNLFHIVSHRTSCLDTKAHE